ELFDLLMPHLEQLQQLAATVAQWDVLQNLAERAENLEYCRPTLLQEAGSHIQGARHPAVEQVMTEPFIANPTELNPQLRI
ncbi:hypothetical protein, partial [Vibrio cholerae]|uniref:hypothetical protein n=1 Tax=Vibrio cholerae TaxID=666 RepID=UPI001C120F83